MANGGNDDRRERLSAARQELLKRRLQGATPAAAAAVSAAAAPPAGLQARADRTLAPASYSQARLYFLDQLHGAGAAYHMVLALRLGGHLDPAAMQCALDTLVARHASLRTTFEMRDGALVQRVAPDMAFSLDEVDLGPTADEEDLHSALRKVLQAPFSLARGPLLRASLIRLGADEHVLVLVLHHIIADEWSLGLLRRELAHCYAQGGSGEGLQPLDVDYGDYALWQREQLGQQREGQLTYWRRQLSNLEDSLAALPGDHRRPARASLRGGWMQRELDGSVVAAVHSLARRHQATPYMVLISVFLAAMSRLSGQTDVHVGTPVAARTPVQTEGLVGLFLNSVVIREQLQAEEPFDQLLGRVRDTALAAVEHQALPFEVLVAELQPERDLGANPLFQTMFVLESDDGAEADFGDLTQQRIAVESAHAKLDLTFFVRLDDDRLTVSVEYARDLYEPTTAAMLIEAYVQLLRSAVAAPATAVGELALLSPRQADAVRARARGPALTLGEDASIVPLVLRRALARGSEAMLIDGVTRLTGDEFHQRIHRVAAALARREIGRGGKVIVALPRGVDQIVALLGVLVAGAAYVPLDPDYPAERRRQVIEDLTVDGHMPLMLSAGTLQEVDRVESLSLAAALAEAPADAAVEVSADDLAYVIYTSGSTGRAKGVAIRHGNLLASTLARTAWYDEAPQRYLLVSSCAFDSSVAGIFWTLMAGECLVIADAEQAADPRALAQLIEQERITHTLMLPGLYALLLEAATAEQLASLRTVIVAGEACVVSVPKRHGRQLPNVRLTNEYGPTEGTVWATAYDCTGTERDQVPIGRPIAGAEAYVLDPRGQLLPDGAVGELWIGGAGVAAGYLEQPRLTQARFLTAPGAGAGRLYRTGDLVRRGHDGELAYLGRTDEQIKLRGFRIEPAEIEGLLRSHPQVHDAAVSVLDGRLVAWCVADGEAPEQSALREYLSHRVPAYMVPTRFQLIEALPRLPNGKVSRNRLADLAAAAAPEDSAPQADLADETERELAAIWRQLLGVDRVAAQDDFFELGGHSLAGVSLMLEIERRFGLALPLATLFQAPRLAALAQRIRDGRTRTGSPLLIPVQPQGALTPLICVHGGARQAAKHLGDDQPVYLAFTHLADRDSEGNSVQTMAQRYLAEVREVQPRGPYQLCGFSFGGKIAYEMACRLRAEGESVALALCDPPPPAGADYYRQQWRLRRKELKSQGIAWGLRLAAQVVGGRLRTWRMRLLDAYFSRTRRSSRVLYGVSAALAALGLAVWTGAGLVLNQPVWRPLVLDLAPEQQASGTFVASAGGRIELALEVDRALPMAQLRRSALAVKQPSPLDMRWQVATEEDGAVVARGDVRDYAYIDPGPRTPLGRLRRILTRVPFGQSERYFASFGLLGLPAAERGVGAFEARAGERYRLEVTTQADLASIDELSPRFVARLDRGRFAERYARTVPYSIGGLATALGGVLLALITFVRQRQNTPASLLSYRDRQHYRRMSARYGYPPYDGDLTLLLPETYAVYRDETQSAWAKKVHGEVHLELVAGAQRHVDLINETAGQRLAAGLARWLRRAEKEKHASNQ